MWVYHSPVGDMVIKPADDGRYVLLCNGEIYGSWISPTAAADDVYCHATGFFDWDVLAGQLDCEPSGISEWEVLY